MSKKNGKDGMKEAGAGQGPRSHSTEKKKRERKRYIEYAAIVPDASRRRKRRKPTSAWTAS